MIREMKEQTLEEKVKEEALGLKFMIDVFEYYKKLDIGFHIILNEREIIDNQYKLKVKTKELILPFEILKQRLYEKYIKDKK